MPKKSLSASEIKHLAQLANLPLSAKATTELQASFSSLIDYIGLVQKIKLTGVKPTAQVTGKVNEFRSDQVKPSLTQQQALSGSPRPTHQGFFVVERILHHES